MQVRAHDGDTVDRLVWRVVGRTAGVTEAVLEANPGLAAVGVTLPAGYPVEIPDRIKDTAATRPVVKLWD
jgi:phage tail protein X